MSKVCPPGKILNPATNRCVKIDGKIGKSLIEKSHKSKSHDSHHSHESHHSHHSHHSHDCHHSHDSHDSHHSPKPKTKKTKAVAKHFTESEIRKMKTQVHPDIYMSKDSVTLLKTLVISEDNMYNVISLAGDICYYVREKKSISVDDINKALPIVRKGKKAIEKETARLDVLRIAMLKRQGYM